MHIPQIFDPKTMFSIGRVVVGNSVTTGSCQYIGQMVTQFAGVGLGDFCPRSSRRVTTTKLYMRYVCARTCPSFALAQLSQSLQIMLVDVSGQKASPLTPSCAELAEITDDRGNALLSC